jgi:hypothetical protein
VVGAARHGQALEVQVEGADGGVPEVFDAVGAGADRVPGPQRGELGAVGGQPADQGADLVVVRVASGDQPERGDGEFGLLVPVAVQPPAVRAEEEERGEVGPVGGAVGGVEVEVAGEQGVSGAVPGQDAVAVSRRTAGTSVMASSRDRTAGEAPGDGRAGAGRRGFPAGRARSLRWARSSSPRRSAVATASSTWSEVPSPRPCSSRV